MKKCFFGGYDAVLLRAYLSHKNKEAYLVHKSKRAWDSQSHVLYMCRTALLATISSTFLFLSKMF